MMTKKHEPTVETRSTVQALASVGTPQEDIAKIIGISSKHTLIKHYRKELDTAMTMANATIAQTLFKQAKNGNTSAAIFWLKCRAGWNDKHSEYIKALELQNKKLELEVKKLSVELNPPNPEAIGEDYKVTLKPDEDIPSEPIL